MRLTPEVMAQSQSHMNPLKERELDLRGHQIPLIENLASHQGTYDTLNMTDNSLVALGNVPLSPRIRTIHVGNNNISSISPNFPTSVPHLETLILTSNALPSLSSLIPLTQLSHLTHLSLVGNPVRNTAYYREWVIWKVGKGKLHTLDFQRIKDAERKKAKELFEDPESHLPTKLAISLTTDSGAASVPGKVNGVAGGVKGRAMTPQEKQNVREAILSATSREEIQKLEKMLQEGRVPEGTTLPGA